MKLQKGQIWTKDGKDFVVHEVVGDEVFGLLYYSKDRGNIDAETTDYVFRRTPLEKFVNEKATLVEVE